MARRKNTLVSVLMPFALSIILSIALSACAGTTPEHGKAKDFVGEITHVQLLDDYQHFDANYQSFEVTDEQASLLGALPADTKIDVYFATWCHDSVREVPRLLKAMATRPDIELNLLALDYKKQDPNGLAEKAGVKFTPTIVVSKNGKELGRIIERPEKGLVEDIAGFVK